MKSTHVFTTPDFRTAIDEVHPLTGKSVIYGRDLEDIRREYPNAIIVTWEEYLEGKAKKQDTPIEWTVTTEERYHEMLNVLPPEIWLQEVPGLSLFLVGEATDHHAKTGRPRFTAYLRRGDEHLECTRPLQVWEAKAIYALAARTRARSAIKMAAVQPDPKAALAVSQAAAAAEQMSEDELERFAANEAAMREAQAIDEFNRAFHATQN